jgi:hypothetical protein
VSELLEYAFNKATTLPVDEQDALAVRLLLELDENCPFDLAIEATANKLAGLTEMRDVSNEPRPPGSG